MLAVRHHFIVIHSAIHFSAGICVVVRKGHISDGGVAMKRRVATGHLRVRVGIRVSVSVRNSGRVRARFRVRVRATVRVRVRARVRVSPELSSGLDLGVRVRLRVRFAVCSLGFSFAEYYG